MEYKLEVARNLRAGLEVIKRVYRRHAFAENPFWEQWTLLRMKQDADIDWHAHTQKQNEFARYSQQLLSRILKGG